MSGSDSEVNTVDQVVETTVTPVPVTCRPHRGCAFCSCDA